MAADKVVHMVAVRHSFVTARRTMSMSTLVPFAFMVGRAGVGIGAADRDGMLVNVFAMHVVHMAVVEIVGVTVMHDRLVPALGTVLVTMRSVFLTCGFHVNTSTTNLPNVLAKQCQMNDDRGIQC